MTDAGGRLLWTERMDVRWGDMDALGHVNNTAYFRYFEQARVAWLGSLGIPMSATGCGPVVVKAGCDFLLPINYPATLDITMRLVRLGNSSFTVVHEIRDAAALYARGEVVTVWVDYARGRSVPLPDAVRRALS